MSSGRDSNFVNHISRFIGEVVTVYTTSGGESGDGFTGVLLSVNDNFLRLLARVGPAPSCALGSCCDRDRDRDRDDRDRGRDRDDRDRDRDRGRINCRFNTTGAVVDIPLDRIASFVHNTL